MQVYTKLQTFLIWQKQNNFSIPPLAGFLFRTLMDMMERIVMIFFVNFIHSFAVNLHFKLNCMKQIIVLAAFIFFANISNAQTAKATTDSLQIVEASCGQCKFGMKGKNGCDLAVRINGVPYFVEGTSIDKHGDAHAKDGFCEAIRKAKVSGTIIDNRFVATSFALLPEEKAKP